MLFDCEEKLHFCYIFLLSADFLLSFHRLTQYVGTVKKSLPTDLNLGSFSFNQSIMTMRILYHRCYHVQIYGFCQQL